jgi:glyoxylase-like metal-dependent hydrolase (beta-lactamase superfamily II)/8-oxo-dGTP pyrophosphatase MutT (NUDIX family)
VILVRFQPRCEVFWVLRAPVLAYLGGFHAFPGGRVSRRDAAVPATGVDDAAERARRVAAVRELFEETGVLLARPGPGASHSLPDESTRRSVRLALQDGSLEFASFLAEYGLAIDAGALLPAGRWISPPFSPRGFDTYFYLGLLPDGETPSVHAGELVGGGWIEPAAALEQWQRGEVLLARPLRRVLELWTGILPDSSADTGALTRWSEVFSGDPEAQGRSIERIEILPGAVLLPLETPTIPPATHTNCLILGEGECLLIDPGSGEPESLHAVETLVQKLGAEGRKVTAIALTHHHDDHISGVAELRRRLGVPVAAHPELAGELAADRVLEDGEKITLANPKGEPWVVEVLFTPGHTKDHVAFFEKTRGVLAAGDLISGLSTVVIDPPDGDLGEYLVSLGRVSELPVRLLIPGHGPPTGGGREHLAALIKHRYWRESKVIESLERGEASPEEMLPAVYDDVPEEQWGLARRSLLAHLVHLEKSGRARRSSDGDRELWRLTGEA